MPFCETMKMRYDKGIYDDIGYTGIKELTAEEMDEINGGLWNFAIGLVATAVSIGCTVAAKIDPDNADIYRGVGIAADVVSVCTMGVSAGAIVKTGVAVCTKSAVVKTTSYSLKQGLRTTTITTGESVGYCIFGANWDMTMLGLNHGIKRALR